jgi:hypothetical protein
VPPGTERATSRGRPHSARSPTPEARRLRGPCVQPSSPRAAARLRTAGTLDAPTTSTRRPAGSLRKRSPPSTASAASAVALANSQGREDSPRALAASPPAPRIASRAPNACTKSRVPGCAAPGPIMTPPSARGASTNATPDASRAPKASVESGRCTPGAPYRKAWPALVVLPPDQWATSASSPRTPTVVKGCETKTRHRGAGHVTGAPLTHVARRTLTGRARQAFV